MLIITTALLLGCTPPERFDNGYTSRDIEGAWLDETNTVTTITRAGSTAQVTSIVDGDDGEAYTVLASGPDEGLFHWRYLVPSTGYTVDIWIDAVDRDAALTHWSNSAGAAGAEQMTRQE